MKCKLFWALAVLLPITAQADCVLNIPSMGAMRYNALDPIDQVVLMSGNVSCTIPSPIRIQASKGASNSFSQRAMVSGTNRLGYNLYLDTSETYVWGDGTFGTVEMSLSAGENTALTANLRIPSGQNPPVGIYSDTLVFTVFF